MVDTMYEEVNALSDIRLGLIVECPAVHAVLKQRPQYDARKNRGDRDDCVGDVGGLPYVVGHNGHVHNNRRCRMNVRKVFEDGILEQTDRFVGVGHDVRAHMLTLG